MQALASQHNATIIAEYTEIESGKSKTRPKLLAAIPHAKRSQATLVVAKLDRLARNVAFTSTLMETGVDFIACDNPHANRLTIHILAAVAEDEAIRISERTKAALAAAMARGQRLGSAREGHWNGREDSRLRGLAKGRQAASKVITKQANEAYSDLYERMTASRGVGQTLQQIADSLNSEGHTTRRGKPWNPTQVMRVLQRA